MVSVIIPNLNNEAALSRLLAQLAGADISVIVSDGLSGDESLRLAARRGAQMRRGVNRVHRINPNP
ncbi:MAG: hypothetical protein HKN36_06375 [Hellea sp.]|nr:hypothetical protein [Hellea sp.]